MGIHLLCLANARYKLCIVSLFLPPITFWLASQLTPLINTRVKQINLTYQTAQKEETRSSTHRFSLLIYTLYLYWQKTLWWWKIETVLRCPVRTYWGNLYWWLTTSTRCHREPSNFARQLDRREVWNLTHASRQPPTESLLSRSKDSITNRLPFVQSRKRLLQVALKSFRRRRKRGNYSEPSCW